MHDICGGNSLALLLRLPGLKLQCNVTVALLEVSRDPFLFPLFSILHQSNVLTRRPAHTIGPELPSHPPKDDM
jgi:hypothetical protein